MKGYGLTVFKGTRARALRRRGHRRAAPSSAPGQALIVVKTPNPRLDVVKTVKGMSGSPIYPRWAARRRLLVQPLLLRGRAGRGRHADRPHAHRDARGRSRRASGRSRGRRSAARGRAHPAPLRTRPTPHSTSFDGAPGTYDLEEHARQLAARLGHGAGCGAGRGPGRNAADDGGGRRPRRSRPFASSSSRSASSRCRAAAASENDPNAPTHFVDGGGLGVQLARGDVSIMGLGTATYRRRRGQGGRLRPPDARRRRRGAARVHRTGPVDQRERAGVAQGRRVRPPPRARSCRIVRRRSSSTRRSSTPVIPIDVDITGVVGAPKHALARRVDGRQVPRAGHRRRSCSTSVIEATSSERRDLTWKMTSRVDIAGHGAVDLEDVGVAERRRARQRRVVPLEGRRDRRRRAQQPLGARARRRSVQARFDVKYSRDSVAPARRRGARSRRRRGRQGAATASPRPPGRARGHARGRGHDARGARGQGRRDRGGARLRRRAGARAARAPRSSSSRTSRGRPSAPRSSSSSSAFRRRASRTAGT